MTALRESASFVDVPYGRLWVEQTGPGRPAVVLAHGTELIVLPGTDHNIQVRSATELTRLSQQFLTGIQEAP
ncbi:MAG: hypothetical protein ACRDQB_15730 [Thermocrispum sp.]